MQLVYSQPCVEENWSCEPPPDVLMGVVASDSRLGMRALRDWCQALGLPYMQPENRVRLCVWGRRVSAVGCIVTLGKCRVHGWCQALGLPYLQPENRVCWCA
jgi:hypothetical protein